MYWVCPFNHLSFIAYMSVGIHYWLLLLTFDFTFFPSFSSGERFSPLRMALVSASIHSFLSKLLPAWNLMMMMMMMRRRRRRRRRKKRRRKRRGRRRRRRRRRRRKNVRIVSLIGRIPIDERVEKMDGRRRRRKG